MLRAALTSRSSTAPHSRQEWTRYSSRDVRAGHAEQVRDVYAGSTATSSLPADRASRVGVDAGVRRLATVASADGTVLEICHAV